MANNQQQNHSSRVWGLLGIALLPMLCCGLPLLISAIGVTAAGTFLAASRYWIFGGLVIVVGVIMLIVSRRRKQSGMDACCVVPPKNNLPPKE